MKTWIRVLAAALFAAVPALPGPAERLQLFEQYLQRRTAEITRAGLTDVRTAEDWKRRRPELRAQLLYMLGLDPLPARTPLRPRITRRFERQGYRVENLVFESMPGLYITGNLYLPSGSQGPRPAVLYVCGHSPVPAGAKAVYQRNGIWLARLGYVVLVIDPIHFSEIPGIHHGLHSLGMWYWLSLGYTPIAPEVWSAMRALDYLETRPEVDRGKFAITGGSGGGAVSWYAAAVDERIRVAVPRCATWTAENQAAANGVWENCDCMYFPNIYQLDFPALAALIAPRPLKILNAMRDPMFPRPGYLEVYRRGRPIYDFYNAGDRIEEYEEDVPHRDTPGFRRMGFGWINRWLRDDTAPFAETDLTPEPEENLRVLPEPPADARNHFIYKTFIPTHRIEAMAGPEAWKRRRAILTAELRDKVFRAFPAARVPFATVKRPEGGWTTKFGDTANLEFATEEGVRVTGRIFRPRGASDLPVFIRVRGAQDLIYQADYDFILPLLGRAVVLELDPRGVDYPVGNARMATLKRTAALAGATLESMQVWDILRSLDYLTAEEQLRPSSISVYGRGEMGALAVYAAALDVRIGRVILDDPPYSHWQGPALMNILRVTDLPEAAALVAPRELVWLTPPAAPYRHTARLFALEGAKTAFREAGGITEALRMGASR